MYSATDPCIQTLLQEWHDAGRARFITTNPYLAYDHDYTKVAKDRQKYIALDMHNIGYFLVDRETGVVYRIKAYGVPHTKKIVGTIGTITGADLARSQRW